MLGQGLPICNKCEVRFQCSLDFSGLPEMDLMSTGEAPEGFRFIIRSPINHGMDWNKLKCVDMIHYAKDRMDITSYLVNFTKEFMTDWCNK